MNAPKNLQYSRTHEWVEDIGNGALRIGLTDHAQHALGDIVFVSLPEVGDELTVGGDFAEVESVKAVSDVFSPVAGKITAINGTLADDPAQINTDCYAAWMVEIEGGGECEELMGADDYIAFAASED